VDQLCQRPDLHVGVQGVPHYINSKLEILKLMAQKKKLTQGQVLRGKLETIGGITSSSTGLTYSLLGFETDEYGHVEALSVGTTDFIAQLKEWKELKAMDITLQLTYQGERESNGRTYPQFKVHYIL